MVRVIPVIVLALLTATAGCLGGVIESRPSDTPVESTTSTTGKSTPLTSSNGRDTTPDTTSTIDDASHTTSTIGDASTRIGEWDRLYRQTIDSVVKLKVVRRNGRISIGSGFVYDSKGRLVTNQHVVDNAVTVMVRFRNGQWRLGEVIGTDVYTDLAVVDVDEIPAFVEPLPIAEQDVDPGDPVVALGSPFGLEGTITHGMVSGVNRSMPTDLGFSIPDTIQTDAPINPGNSGGPLVSANGTVVGVNRATRGDNVGFAISADVLQRVVSALIAEGAFHHPYLGIRTKTVTPVIAAANDLSNVTGVIVTRFLPRSPAEGTIHAATEKFTDTGRAIPVGGDVIVRVNERKIRTRQALRRYLLLHTRPGETVRVTVLREGERRTLTVELGRRPEFPSG